MQTVWFIGDEWDYIILSLVRSMPEFEIEGNPSIDWCERNMGFITDEHQINVALTRARAGLIIIGAFYFILLNMTWTLSAYLFVCLSICLSACLFGIWEPRPWMFQRAEISYIVTLCETIYSAKVWCPYVVPFSRCDHPNFSLWTNLWVSVTWHALPFPWSADPTYFHWS